MVGRFIFYYDLYWELVTNRHQVIEPKNADFIYHPKMNEFRKLHLSTLTIEEAIARIGYRFWGLTATNSRNVLSLIEKI